MNILITGGAGYIGSCATLKIIKNYKSHCIILDKQETINLTKLIQSYNKNLTFYKVDLTNYHQLKEIFQDISNKFKIDVIIHFAAYTIVSESEANPYKYFHNNINSTLNLLELMIHYEIPHIIFSSSASVYGKANYIPINESHPLNPLSAYALSKKISEDLIIKYSQKGINYINLRYFNPAGSIDNLGEEHNPETHLIPLLVKSLIEGKTFRIFGNDFPTKDGTCIRDFIHIQDLVVSHLISLEHLLTGKVINETFNVGINKGYSVLEVVQKSLEIFKNKINPHFKYIFDKRREGDVPILLADSQKIQEMMNFKPNYDLEDILYSVWNYEMEKISL